MELMEPLTEEEQDEIYAEVGYKREQLDQDVKQIKEWLEQQHHLPPSRLKENDNFLKTYLAGCKGSLEKVKKKLDAYYTFRGNTSIFENRDPHEEEYSNKTSFHATCLLPRLSKSKDIVLICQLGSSNIKHFNCLINLRKIFHLLELRMRMSDVVINVSYVMDMQGMTASHLALIPPLLIRDSLYFAETLLPYRIKHLIFINVPTIFEVAVNSLIKPFLTKKLKERYYIFSGGYETLYTFLDKSKLPKEYGGELAVTLKSLSDLWRNRETIERDWFINELSEKTDESKRVTIEGTIFQDSYFGVHGSLKKLVLD